jgi:hypothetical protein
MDLVEGYNKQFTLVLQVRSWLRVNTPNPKNKVTEAWMIIQNQFILGKERIPRRRQMKHCRITQTTVKPTPLLNPNDSVLGRLGLCTKLDRPFRL